MRGLVIANTYYRQRFARAAIEQLMRFIGCELRLTEFPGHARYIAEEAVDAGVELIVAAGGDGTINEIVNGLVGSQTVLAVLPIGTANDLARCMKISRRTMEAPYHLSDARVRRVDLIKVNGWHFATAGGFGLPGEVLARMESLRTARGFVGAATRITGGLGYLCALCTLLKSAAKSRGELAIRTDSGGLIGEFISVLVANQSCLGYVFHAAPKARNNDGCCDLMLIAPGRTLHSFLALGSTLVPREIPMENIVRLRSKDITITCDRPVNFFGDGEMHLHDHEFRIEVVPRALRVLVPPVFAPVSSFSGWHSDTRRPTTQPTPLCPTTVCATTDIAPHGPLLASGTSSAS